MKTPISKAVTVILTAGLTATLAACSSQSSQRTADSSYAAAVQTTAVPETVSPPIGTSAAPEATAETKPDTAYTKASTSAKAETAVTTTASTTTSTTASTTASTPATTAEPIWKETKLSADMYLNTSVYSRSKAYLGAPTADLYQINDKVKVVAVTDTGYYKLENGRFIHCDYLSSEKTVIQTMTATTPPPETTAPAAVTTANKKQTPIKKGKYISSGYEPLDEIIFPLLDNLVSDNMSDDDKRLAIYDYLVQFQYQERTLLIPKNKKQYEEQLEAISLFEKGYGLCYDFSSAFKYMTKAIGMNTVMYYGSHKGRSSAYTPHSWTMLEIDGTLYFFDPSMERVMINDGMGEGQHYRYKKPYYWFYDYYITDYTSP